MHFEKIHPKASSYLVDDCDGGHKEDHLRVRLGSAHGKARYLGMTEANAQSFVGCYKAAGERFGYKTGTKFERVLRADRTRDGAALAGSRNCHKQSPRN